MSESDLTPKEIVAELDRHIIGQKEAKRAVAIALRNRWRRRNVEPTDLQDEIVPKNILMIGPTGVGKTEVSRRLAKLANAPFLKVEATKFTEIGYVGRDVDSIARDLVEVSVTMVRDQMRKEVKEKAYAKAEERVLDALVGDTATTETREKFRKMLRDEELNDKEIDIEVLESGGSAMTSFDIPGMPGSQMGVMNIGDMLGKALGGDRMKSRRMTVEESHDLLIAEESDKLIDEDKIIKDALKLVENEGIVFIDEIDKVCARTEVRGEVNREGVQRDLLPLLEGSCVATKYGTVKTDHILFIASGAFHMAKPADLLPELQGRLPIRVELAPLSKEDLVRILKEPEASLLKQYSALMDTEKTKLTFKDKAVERIAEIATTVNREIENIGARRLHTIMEKLLEDLSFDASDSDDDEFIVTEKYVDEQLGDLTADNDLSKFIL